MNELNKSIDQFFEGTIEEEALKLLVQKLDEQEDNLVFYFLKKLCDSAKVARLNQRVFGAKVDESEGVSLGFQMGVQAILNGLNDPKNSLIAIQKAREEEAKRKAEFDSKKSDVRHPSLEDPFDDALAQDNNEPSESGSLA